MAEPLSECAKSVFRVLTGRIREQLITLLRTYKELLEIELASLVSMVNRGDVVAALFTKTMNNIQTVLDPIEEQLAQIPFVEFKRCPDLKATVGNIENLYFDKKAELSGLAYRYAQFGFATAWVTSLRDKLEEQIDIIDQMIIYIDNVASLNLTPSSAVYVYTREEDALGNKYSITREGVIDTVGVTEVIVTMNDTGANETFSPAEVQPK